MASWSDRWRVIRRGVLELHAWLALFGAIGVAFAAAVAGMSWLTKSITFLAQYGWGLPVIAAIGIVLVIVVGLSFAAVPIVEAWRRFRPLPPAIPQGAGTAVHSLEATGIDPSLEIGRVERQIEVLKASLPPLEQHGRDLVTRIDQLGADIVRLNELGVTQHQINDDLRTKLDRQAGAQAVILTDLQKLETNLGYLIDAVRARDAIRYTLVPNDEIVMSLGRRLIEAAMTDYPDSASWLSDHQRCNAALRTIDQLFINWTRVENGVAPPNPVISLFDLGERHFQHSPMPPENIKAEDTIIPFKTLWNVQSRYANRRDGIFSYFHAKAALPGES
jgi:hypothetical protein